MIEKTSSARSASERWSRAARETVLPAVEMAVMASRSRESTRTSAASGSAAARAAAAPRTSSARAADSVITSRTSASCRIHRTWEAESVS